jgi:hypothetical protein
MASRAALARMSKGAWFILILFVVLPFLLFGAPYIYRMATNRWAWTALDKNSLTGIWTGAVTLRDSMDRTVGTSAEEHADTAMLLEMHMQVSGWMTHTTGSVVTCHGGVLSRYTYRLGDVNVGGVNGDTISMMPVASGGSTTLKGTRVGDRLEVIWKLSPGSASGVLHKGSRGDFDALCQVVKK